MKSNTEFNKYKVKNDELYLPKSGGKVEGEAVFTGGVRFSSGDPKNDLVIKDKRSLGTATGHEYDLEFNNDLDEVTLTEDNVDKTTLPLVATYVGTEADFNSKTVAEKVKYKIAITDTPTNNFSHIGQIIETTTLDTEAKVRAVYGASTSWIQHTGYMLRGASSGVIANSAVKTGGNDTHTLTVNEMPSHSHKTRYGDVAGGDGSGYRFSNTTGISYQIVQNDGGGQPHNNLPSYKSVYIWERIA